MFLVRLRGETVDIHVNADSVDISSDNHFVRFFKGTGETRKLVQAISREDILTISQKEEE